MTSIQTLPDLGIYIHIPWCVRKCPYCDFNSHEQSGELPESQYVKALLKDFAQDLSYVQSRPIRSIFFGGGTPSLFSPAAFSDIFEGLQQKCAFTEDIEITMEANPGTAERHRFADYRHAGINRLSIGIQSFADHQLRQLGRIHGDAEAKQAIEMAMRDGFENINLDIMYALPGQTTAEAVADLKMAVSYQPQHISWYQLTVEPNTEFYSRPPRLPAESEQLRMQERGLKLLDTHGFKRYEVSAFARSGRQSEHNLNYWRFGDYIGIGAGAHGKITCPGQGIIRTRKNRQPRFYIENSLSYTAEKSLIEKDDLVLEFMLNSLRLREGFTRSGFEATTGLAFSEIEKQVESLRRDGMLECPGNRITTTETGFRFLNNVLEAFL